MTTIETTTTTTAALVDAVTLKAIAVAASTDQARPILCAVAFTLTDDAARDRWQLQATDSYVAAWTSASPATDGHHLVDAKAIVAALRTVGAKRDLVSVAFSERDCTVTGPNGAVTLPRVDGTFPNLSAIVRDNGQTGAVDCIGLTSHAMGKVTAIAKLVGDAPFALSFTTAAKPVRVRFTGDDNVSMIVMPARLS